MLENGMVPGKHSPSTSASSGQSWRAGEEDSPHSQPGCWSGRPARKLFDDLPKLGTNRIPIAERSVASLDANGVAWLDDDESVDTMKAFRFAVVGRLLGCGSTMSEKSLWLNGSFPLIPRFSRSAIACSFSGSRAFGNR